MTPRQFALFQDMRLTVAKVADAIGVPVQITDSGLWTSDEDGKTRIYVEANAGGVELFLQGSKVVPSFLYHEPDFTLPILMTLLRHPPIKGVA